MSAANTYDAGNLVKAMPGIPSTGTIPSSSGAAINGVAIDRLSLGRRYYACRSILQGRLVGSTQQTATINATFQHSSDGTSWDNYSTATNPTAVAIGSTGATGAQSTDGIVEQAVNLRAARRYVRQVATAPVFALTTSGDTLCLGGSVVFCGPDESPAA